MKQYRSSAVTDHLSHTLDHLSQTHKYIITRKNQEAVEMVSCARLLLILISFVDAAGCYGLRAAGLNKV